MAQIGDGRLFEWGHVGLRQWRPAASGPRSAYSILIPALLAIRLQRDRSAASSALTAAGVEVASSAPALRVASTIAGSFPASTIAFWSRSTTAAGVPTGAKKAFQLTTMRSLQP